MIENGTEPPAFEVQASLVLAALRALFISLFTASLYSVYLIRQVGVRDKDRLLGEIQLWTHFWARVTCRVCGIRIRGIGPCPAKGSLIAPNHIGYVDVWAVLAFVPCFFVSRADVADWPLIGALLRRSRQILVSRRRVRNLKQTADQIGIRLEHQHSVCVFLEGTSTGGSSVLPFRPPLLEPAVSAGAPLVPMAIRWGSRGSFLNIAEDVAYWKDHSFVPHLWRLLGLTGLEVTLQMGDPIDSRGVDRRSLAEAAHEAVLRMLKSERN